MFSSVSSDYIFGKFADFAPHLSPELDRFCTHILLQTLVPTSFQDTSDPNVAASATGGRNVGSIENNDVENIVMKAPGGVIQILNMTSHDIPISPIPRWRFWFITGMIETVQALAVGGSDPKLAVIKCGRTRTTGRQRVAWNGLCLCWWNPGSVGFMWAYPKYIKHYKTH